MHSKVVPLECARSARKFLGIVVYRKNFASCVSDFFGGVSYRNFFSYRTRIVIKKTLPIPSTGLPKHEIYDNSFLGWFVMVF